MALGPFVTYQVPGVWEHIPTPEAKDALDLLGQCEEAKAQNLDSYEELMTRLAVAIQRLSNQADRNWILKRLPDRDYRPSVWALLNEE